MEKREAGCAALGQRQKEVDDRPEQAVDPEEKQRQNHHEDEHEQARSQRLFAGWPNDLFGFYDIVTFQAMKLALTDWVGSYADQSSSGKLPPWPQGADGPDAGEFPFFVEEGVTRDLYEDVRAEDRAMVCFIQGGESLLCLVKHPRTGDLEAIGVQTFPG